MTSSSSTFSNRVSEYPAVNKALTLLHSLMENGELDAGEASDLSERVWDCHHPSTPERIIRNYVAIKRFVLEEHICEELAQKLYDKNMDRPIEVEMEIDIFERLLTQNIPEGLKEKMKTLLPSATQRYLKAALYVRSMVQELLTANIISEDYKKALEAKDSLLAELELRLSIPQRFDISDTEQAQSVREKLDYWLKPSGWPKSEIQ